MADIKEVLNRHREIRNIHPGILNIAAHTKIKDGKDTGVPAIVIYVAKKLPRAALSPEQTIPEEIDGVKTDVIELAPTTWKAGKTGVSEMHPEAQRHLLGARPAANPKVVRVVLDRLTPSGNSDLSAVANAIQNQANCGSCLSFDYIATWETKIALAYLRANNLPFTPANIALALKKLSEGHLFFCDPLASCENGSSPDDIITQALKGVALLADCPYVDSDQACGTGLAPDWWKRGYMLSGQNAISDPTQILLLLDVEALAATFQVPQSFLNYIAGIYTRLANDPIVGGHGVADYGYARPPIVPLAFNIMRNQWDITWGQNCVINGVARPGWFMIDPTLLDPVMYQLILSDQPIPQPGPNPTPNKCWLCSLFQKRRLRK